MEEITSAEVKELLGLEVIEERLPPELEERIDRSIRSGVSFSMGRHLGVTAIHWHREFGGNPADPNPLAEAILDKVGTQEMPLDLDGHQYFIRKKI
jgi:hypothetical protein